MYEASGLSPTTTGCSLNIVFFSEIFKYSGLWPFSVFPRCQCVYTHQAGRTPALQQNWQSSEKSQNFKEKTQYLMDTLYLLAGLINDGLLPISDSSSDFSTYYPEQTYELGEYLKMKVLRQIIRMDGDIISAPIEP